MSERDAVVLYVNGERQEVRGKAAFVPLANYLRSTLHKTGTKIVCAEGDCGACTVLKSTIEPDTGKLSYRGINACIFPVFLADGSHIITVEGLAPRGELSPVQQAMVDHYGSQCGFCTPGFVVALTDMFERNTEIDAQTVKNHLTGNLCRCTGYQPIIEAAMAVEASKVKPMSEIYPDGEMTAALSQIANSPVHLKADSLSYHGPTDIADAVQLRKRFGTDLRIYSGATDLGVRDNKGAYLPRLSMSLHHIKELNTIEEIGDRITVGAKVSLRRLEQFCRVHCPDLARFLHIFASPQIKESGTLVGNMVNGSPIADTLPFLFVADAIVHCASTEGERAVPIDTFFQGYKTLDLRSDELVFAISFAKVAPDERLRLYKCSSRRDLDISTVNASFVASGKPDSLKQIKMAYGGVGPVPVRLRKTEAFLSGKDLGDETLRQAQQIMAQEITPISDVRGTSEYRHRLAFNLLKKFRSEWLES